ncbi:hypothetical protein TraAM80_09007 [Trypanosoma rangeli]|uniref:UTP23 sensor motif region domain-containing protein n=1 Tax=Trypanosoma rangeli TaxID=5698 RepID=A0A3R7N7R9_TRYRA|nr:uncharacterized protein TraAM80_09007 [Trypanosoma rangeli]RNE98039.1 hypothetical protein TraAM80_09007 [Trypanosoma rangeli]|eukprot:RNE98039.1 hypothetical protein TraAM80_09007 [Trypanosoma rangeli]
MKRRVLRAHANKRRLRLISAEHGLRLDAYSILCDASFLRALVLAEGAGDRSPAQTLKTLMYDTFAAATSHGWNEKDTDNAAGAAQVRKHKDLSFAVHYLPETAMALRRMAQQQQQPEERETASAPRKRNGNEGNLRQPAVREQSRPLLSVVESLLAGLECTGGGDSSASRNEAKAIAQFVAAGSVESRIPHAAQKRKNAHFFFVATQSHDVRRLLPRNAALIRLTTSPTALWIERNGDAFHYGVDGANNTSGQEAAAATGGKMLSAADVAFMRHLSADLLPAAGVKKRRRAESNNAAARISEVTMAPHPKATPVTGHRGDMGGGGAKRPRRKAAGGPNPLAVKKKRVREVFRVDSGVSKKTK